MRLQELAAKTEARLDEQTRLMEQVSPHCVLCPDQAPGWVWGVCLICGGPWPEAREWRLSQTHR